MRKVIPWNKGLTGIVSSKKGKKYPHLTGVNSSQWKGDKVGYSALHIWVKKVKGKPEKCKRCGTKENLQWANKDHKYSRKLEDWIPLCRKCHYYYDENTLNIKHGYNRTKK